MELPEYSTIYQILYLSFPYRCTIFHFPLGLYIIIMLLILQYLYIDFHVFDFSIKK